MKAIATNWKTLRYLFWLGPMLVLAGLSAGIVSGSWNSVPVGLLLAGLVLIGLWLLLQRQFQESSSLQPGFWSRRSTQTSTNALIATLAFLTVLGLINFLGVRYAGRLDLTENQQFTLAPQTQELVRNLKQPLKVWVFDPQQNPQDRELLESYRRQNSQFSFEFVDPNAQPGVAEAFKLAKDVEGLFAAGDTFIELPLEQRRQFVQNVSLQQRLSEVKLTNAIERISNNRPINLYFLQGHGERPIEQGQGAITQAVESLKEKNYTPQPLNLVQTSAFPDNANVVVIAGPQRPLIDSEITALQTYLNQGGGLLLMVDPNTNPNLDRLLTDWGVTFDNRVVIDASGRLAQYGPAAASVTQYGNHPITQDFGNTLSFYPLARPVDSRSVSGVQSTPLLFTSEQSWAESNLKTPPIKFDNQSDRPGPLVLGFALSRPVTQPSTPSPKPSPSPSPGATSSPQASPSPSPAGSPTPPPSPSPATNSEKPKESRLVVLGNSSFAADGLFGQGINGDVFLNSTRWLSQQDQQALSIRPKESKNRRITLSDQQANLTAWTAIGILPLLGFGTAFAVWWRRR